MNQHQLSVLTSNLGGNLSSGTSRFMKTPCLLAPWRHDGGVDNKPSAGISTDHPHVYTCFSCGSKHTLFELVYEIHRLNQGDPAPYEINFKDALELVMVEEDGTANPLAFDPSMFKDYEAMQNQGPVAWPESFLKDFPTAYDHWYVAKRGVPYELAKALDIRFDPYSNRIAFPIRDFSGRLMGFHGRSLDDSSNLRYFSYGYMGGRNPQIMIGENLVDASKPVVVTEGMFDLTAIMKVYPNVLALKSCSIQKGMLKRLEEFPSIITAFDTGVGGQTGRHTINLSFDHSRPVVHMIPKTQYGDYGATPVSEISTQLNYVFNALS